MNMKQFQVKNIALISLIVILENVLFQHHLRIYLLFIYYLFFFIRIVELCIDGVIAVSFLYISYATRNVSNEFNDSLGLFLTGMIVNILFFFL